MTPKALGFRMPAEWERHRATWLSWPHNLEDWPGKFEPVPWVYADIVKKLATVERVRILVRDPEMEENVRAHLTNVEANLAAVDFYHHETNRSWTRDFCPIFLKNAEGEVAITDWRFNGWAKYDNWVQDDAAPAVIAEALGMRRWQPEWNGQRIVLEGGSIEVNGAGLLLTTEECLLSPVQARNPGLTRADVERVFAEYLGIEKTLWLGNGIAGDDTHGHIDDLARFVDENTVVTVIERDPQDPNYEPLQENLRRLGELPFRSGVPLAIELLPMPTPIYFDGQRLPASYANFYIANELVLVPTFNDAQDHVALNTLARLFPDRQVVGVHSLDLVLGLGTLHCMTQQEPAGA